MKIATNNQQSLLKIRKRETSDLVAFFMKKASRLIPERQWQDISLVVADNTLMASLNQEFMTRDCPTDVLSFCLPPMPGEPELYSGEIFVNAECAIEIAKGDLSATAKELALYIAHGCDHLMDQEDDDVPSRRRMRNRELRWIKEADTLGLLSAFISQTKQGRKSQ